MLIKTQIICKHLKGFARQLRGHNKKDRGVTCLRENDQMIYDSNKIGNIFPD